ncbi:hypothetical protein FHS94_003932 [Sphingomonas aerophila]|uniref:Uncharacterized protein n=1 Tax=Sphingomonas aerophila TaxID=1344948 RepID=A0A7W9BHD1_9SPHN|nr:hypothetical protein [Sphingomonas aerophila]
MRNGPGFAVLLTLAALTYFCTRSPIKSVQTSECWRTDAFRVRIAGQVLTLPKTVKPELKYLNRAELAYVELPQQRFSMCQRKTAVPLDVRFVEIKSLRLVDEEGTERSASAYLSALSTQKSQMHFRSITWPSTRAALVTDGARISCSDPPAARATKVCELSPIYLGNMEIALFISGPGQSQETAKAMLKPFDDQLYQWLHS